MIISVKEDDWNLLIGKYQINKPEEDSVNLSYKEMFFDLLKNISSLQLCYKQKMENLIQNVNIDKGIQHSASK
jgi:hypothetical protein